MCLKLMPTRRGHKVCLINYLDTRSASTEKRARIDLLDLKEQREGEAHIFFKSKIVRARMFYANPEPCQYMRLNQFLKVEKPPTRVLIELEQRFAKFKQIIDSKSYMAVAPAAESEDINMIAHALKENDFLDPIERGVSALIAYQTRSEPEEVTYEEEISEEELNIYTKLRVSHLTRDILITDDMERFSQPILTKPECRANCETLERLSGKAERNASNIANEIVNDMELATYYPPEIHAAVSREEAIDATRQLIYHLQEARHQAEMGGED